MKVIKKFVVVLFPVFLFLVANNGATQQASSLVLGGYEQTAVLDHIDFATGQVIIGGQSYDLAQGVKWYGLEPGTGPEEQRHRFYKKRVGYALTGSAGNPAVSAIWVLSY